MIEIKNPDYGFKSKCQCCDNKEEKHIHIGSDRNVSVVRLCSKCIEELMNKIVKELWNEKETQLQEHNHQD